MATVTVVTDHPASASLLYGLLDDMPCLADIQEHHLQVVSGRNPVPARCPEFSTPAGKKFRIRVTETVMYLGNDEYEIFGVLTWANHREWSPDPTRELRDLRGCYVIVRANLHKRIGDFWIHPDYTKLRQAADAGKQA